MHTPNVELDFVHEGQSYWVTADVEIERTRDSGCESGSYGYNAIVHSMKIEKIVGDTTEVIPNAYASRGLLARIDEKLDDYVNED